MKSKRSQNIKDGRILCPYRPHVRPNLKLAFYSFLLGFMSLWQLSATVSADVTDIRPWDIFYTYYSPYLLRFDFDILDQNNNRVFLPPTDFTVNCYEDGTTISLSESGVNFVRQKKLLKAFLVMDYTNSMASLSENGDSNGDGKSDAIDAMEQGAKDFVSTKSVDSWVGLCEFHREDKAPTIVSNFATSQTYLTDKIDHIWTDNVTGFPASTRCWDALDLAVKNYNGQTVPDEERVIICLTDGADESSVITTQALAQEAKDNGVRIIFIGYGKELYLGRDRMRDIAGFTDGSFFEAADVTSITLIYNEIAQDLLMKYQLQWATLKRRNPDTGPFQPSFNIQLGSASFKVVMNKDKEHPEELYDVTSHAGDVTAGVLYLSAAPTLNGETDVYLRAIYVPRYITRINLTIQSTTSYTASLVQADEDGLCANWTMAMQDTPNGKTIQLASPAPDVLESAIPFAAFGKILKLHFTGLPNREFLALPDNFSVTVDDSIYLNGQTLQVTYFPDIPPVAGMSLTPPDAFTPSGPAGGPIAPQATIYTVLNDGKAPLNWSASANQPWITIAPNSGTLDPNMIQDVVVSLADNVNSFTAGVYNATIRFSNDVNGFGNANRTVTLTVNATTPTVSPTPNPTPNPTPHPTRTPSPSPTSHPTPHPTASPTPHPTPSHTPAQTPHPTPTSHPAPSATPTPVSNYFQILYRREGKGPVVRMEGDVKNGVLTMPANASNNDTLSIVWKRNADKLHAPGIKSILTNGGFKKLSTVAPIQEVNAVYSIFSLTATNCTVGKVSAAGAIGSIKMTRGPANVTLTTPTTQIVAKLGVAALGSVQLAGVNLASLSAPLQGFSTINVSSKKVARGDVAKADIRLTTGTGTCINVKSAKTLSANGSSIQGDVIGAIATISAKSLVLDGALYQSDVKTAAISAKANALKATVTGGDWLVDTLAADGEITAISSVAKRYAPLSGVVLAGGHIGPIAEPGTSLTLAADQVASASRTSGYPLIASGVDPEKKPNVKLLSATSSIRADVFAGAQAVTTSGTTTLTPTSIGEFKRVKVTNGPARGFYYSAGPAPARNPGCRFEMQQGQ
ncbi:MAG: VWA domain-containing protein [Candidatus Sumerlaeota bacterium]|nr:VWA domain-containing protein [Candidatus Sumerlaeota bacterium]